jgi:hypothetical protein
MEAFDQNSAGLGHFCASIGGGDGTRRRDFWSSFGRMLLANKGDGTSFKQEPARLPAEMALGAVAISEGNGVGGDLYDVAAKSGAHIFYDQTDRCWHVPIGRSSAARFIQYVAVVRHWFQGSGGRGRYRGPPPPQNVSLGVRRGQRTSTSCLRRCLPCSVEASLTAAGQNKDGGAHDCPHD